MKKRHASILISLFAQVLFNQYCLAADYKLSKGQTVYVSVHSTIFTAAKAVPFHLEATLIIRNTDPSSSFKVTGADFYDTEGKLLKNYFPEPVELKPLETRHIFIPQNNLNGGVGANFIVRWAATEEINAPIIECLMTGTKSGQGISFVSLGQDIKEKSK